MDASALQDKISRGMGVAARKLGSRYIVYRPRAVSAPVVDRNRVIKLFAAFEPAGNIGSGSARFQPIWRGVFDASYTQAGDYVVGSSSTYFVATQTPAQPVWCVLTNRSVTITRPGFSSQGGYSGLYASPGAVVLTSWPAALFSEGANSKGGKTGSSGLGGWTVLLPPLKTALQVSDVMTDDVGGTYTVDAVEQNSLGWRLFARQISA